MKNLLRNILTKHGKFMRYFLAILSVIILLTGCATTPPTKGRHDYTVAVVNRSGNPIAGVFVSGNSLDRNSKYGTLNNIECTTSNNGLCVFPVETALGYYWDDMNYAKSQIGHNDIKYDGGDWKWGFATAISLNTDHFEYFNLPDNYYFNSFEVAEDTNVSKPPLSVPPVSVPTFVIKLMSVKELLCKQHIVSVDDIKVAQQNITSTVNKVLHQASSKEYEILSLRSSSQQGKDYISISINFPVVFNVERQSRYENTREIVDRVVRGVAGAMNNNLYDWCIDGYNIKVHAERQSFIHAALRRKDVLQESLFLDIYMPKEIVHQYAQHEITGQHLINSSIILLNGERIDVKMY